MLCLLQAKVWERGHLANDETWDKVLTNAFTTVNHGILALASAALSWSAPSGNGQVSRLLDAAISGSSAMHAVYDHQHSVLRIACVGVSRAVLGRHTPQSACYSAIQLSEDQNDSNVTEVARFQSQHPEKTDVVDPITGRLRGLSVTRAFGDARWKWNDETNQRAHERFWKHRPRPKGATSTPPYLTAEPGVTKALIKRYPRLVPAVVS